jgi:hypothetical protein
MNLWMLLSPFAVALMGAGVGAWTAQWIAARNKRNDQRLEEVRAANAATTIAYGITDHFLGMKEQIIKPMIDQFSSDRADFIKANAAPKPVGLTVIVFKVPLDAFRLVACQGIAEHRIQRPLGTRPPHDGHADPQPHARDARHAGGRPQRDD